MTDEDIPPEGVPDRRRHGYVELETKLDKHTREITDRLNRFFIKALAAFAVIGMTSALGILGFTRVLSQQEQTSKDIQRQRFESLVMSCEDQNKRHDATLARVQMRFPARTVDTVTFLVDALQPFVHDCEAYARTRVKGEVEGQ